MKVKHALVLDIFGIALHPSVLYNTGNLSPFSFCHFFEHLLACSSPLLEVPGMSAVQFRDSENIFELVLHG
jgi:hypothetical protein